MQELVHIHPRHLSLTGRHQLIVRPQVGGPGALQRVAGLGLADLGDDRDAQQQAEALQAKYNKLNANRWVQAALWCQRVFWIGLIALVGINIFVAASPMLGGWAINLGKNFVRLASFVGPGAYLREAQLKKKGQS